MPMPLSDLSALKSRMDYLQARQAVLARNVANASTPGYVPRDVYNFDPWSRLGSDRRFTLPTSKSAPSWDQAERTHWADQYETRPSGNAVVLEDEMTKVADTQADFQRTATLYQKSLALLKLAIGKRA